MKKLILISSLLILTSALSAQKDFDLVRSFNYGLSFQQIKDEMNYGLVFSGMVHRFNYRNSWKVNEKDLLYDGQFGVGPLTSRDMLGLHFYLKPIDALYHIYERERMISISAGPWLKIEYNYQLYPELQSGYSFYFTNYLLGLGLSAKYNSDNMYLRLRWKNSLFGMVARQGTDRDPYFFELSLGTYLRDQHQNFKGGSFGLFNSTSVELLYVNPLHPRLGYSYTFEYFQYNDVPTAQSLSHTLTLFFYPKS